MGDGIVVIFNDPILYDDHVHRAGRMRPGNARPGKQLRGAWLQMGYDLDLGVGFAAGYATLGTVGFEGRLDYGTIGNLPNAPPGSAPRPRAARYLRT